MEFIKDIINEWDPIGLFPMAPKDEYEDEINQITMMLQDRDLSIEKIEENIEKIFTKSFGEDLFYAFTSKHKCREIAEKLYQIKVQNQLKDIFIKLGFANQIINDNEYLVFHDTYCKISYIQSVGSFVIESADNYRDAQKGVLEDSDWFSIEDIIENPERIKEVITNYYM